MPHRRGNQEGSLHQREDGTWRVQITLNGNRLSYSAKTRQECQDWLKKMIRQIDSGLTYKGANMLLIDFLELWMKTIKENRRPKTYLQYQAILTRYVLQPFKNHRLRDMQPLQIENYLTQKQSDGLGDRTCQLIYAILHAALHAAVRKGLIGRNPMDAVDKPKVRNPRQKVTLEADQVQQFLIAAMGDRNEMLYHFAVITGLRAGEILGLKWEDVDWIRQRIKIQRQVQYIPRQGLVFCSPKTSAGTRTIAIGNRTMEKLKEHLKQQQLLRAAAGDRWKENNLIFPSGVGTPQDPNNLTKGFHMILEKAGLPLMRFHDLRHTSITLVLNDIGAPVKEAQHRAGHATPLTTINIYGGEVTSKLDDMVAQSLDDLVIPVPLALGPNKINEEEKKHR